MKAYSTRPSARYEGATDVFVGNFYVGSYQPSEDFPGEFMTRPCDKVIELNGGIIHDALTETEAAEDLVEVAEEWELV